MARAESVRCSTTNTIKTRIFFFLLSRSDEIRGIEFHQVTGVFTILLLYESVEDSSNAFLRERKNRSRVECRRLRRPLTRQDRAYSPIRFAELN